MHRLALFALIALAGGPARAASPVYPTNRCVATKLSAAAAYCRNAARAWGAWDVSQDSARRDAALAKAAALLATRWSKAELDAAAKGVDCSETTATVASMQSSIDTEIQAVRSAIHEGLDLNVPAHARCSRSLLRAAGAKCRAFLAAEATFVTRLDKDPQRTKRESKRNRAVANFTKAWNKATAGSCPTMATESALQSLVEDLVGATIELATISPAVPDTAFATITPPAVVTYQGETLRPRCAFDTPFSFFAKRGTTNNLLIYYQGGGACWNWMTCGFLVTFDTSVDPLGSDNPNNLASPAGFANLSNPNNPFKDWNIIFVPYCTGDLHFGDADREYTNSSTVLVYHRGYHNARVVEKWAREHFVNPDEVFVAGTSAGAYGAFFNAPLHHFVWPASHFSVLGDAGNGVITTSFLLNELPTWNLTAHIPATIPNVLAALQGGGLPVYVSAVASFFPHTAWAHYTTAYDGGSGGQSGFYNIMLNPTNVLQWARWWDATCQWNSVAMSQLVASYASNPTNYRYYVGAGSRHGMWGLNKVYTDQSGGESMTIVDWVQAMRTRSAQWVNVQCTDCGKVLAGDPKPSPLEAPFVSDPGSPSGARIVCP
ncbi:MAG: pectinacetylesterase family protein [Candidatus Binatia bacterium]|nr:pectinacetylesterase family protein [Candidatus Binatia bacterium]